MRSAVTRVAALAACVVLMVPASGAVMADAGVSLSGAWELNRDLSSPPGGMPDGGDRGRGDDGGRRGPGGGGRGPGGGFGGGLGGGRSRGPGGGGRPGGERPSQEQMEAGRALLAEVMDLPARFTIIQDGAKLIVTEPDGVVRTYLVNGKTEKHQLTNGTIETKASWDGPSLVMHLTAARATLVRTFTLRDDPRRLEVATGFDRAPKDARRLLVYDEAATQG